jgi:hypothetical protein
MSFYSFNNKYIDMFENFNNLPEKKCKIFKKDSLKSEQKNNFARDNDFSVSEIKNIIDYNTIDNLKNQLFTLTNTDNIEDLIKSFNNSDEVEKNNIINKLAAISNLSLAQITDNINKLISNNNPNSQNNMQIMPMQKSEVTHDVPNMMKQMNSAIQQMSNVIQKVPEMTSNLTMNNDNKLIYVDLNCLTEKIKKYSDVSTDTMMDLDLLLSNIKTCTYEKKKEDMKETFLNVTTEENNFFYDLIKIIIIVLLFIFIFNKI